MDTVSIRKFPKLLQKGTMNVMKCILSSKCYEMLTRFLLFEKFGVMYLFATDSDVLRGKRSGEIARFSNVKQILVSTAFETVLLIIFLKPRVYICIHLMI